MQKYHAIMRLNPSAKREISVARPIAPNPLSYREKKFSKKICDWTAKLQSHDSVAKRVQNSEKNSSQMLILQWETFENNQIPYIEYTDSE